MFIYDIRTLYGHPKGAMDIFFWVGNHFLSVAKYFIPLINILKKVKKTHLERNPRGIDLCLHFVGEEWACLQKLFKGIYY